MLKIATTFYKRTKAWWTLLVPNPSILKIYGNLNITGLEITGAITQPPLEGQGRVHSMELTWVVIMQKWMTLVPCLSPNWCYKA